MAIVLTGFLGSAGVARANTTPDNNDNPFFTLTMNESATQNLVTPTPCRSPSRVPSQGTAAGLEIAAVGTGWCASDVQLPVSETPSQSFTSFVPTGFPPVQATTPGASAPNCLEYVNSDLSAVVADGSSLPTIAPQPNTNPNIAASQAATIPR